MVYFTRALIERLHRNSVLRRMYPRGRGISITEYIDSLSDSGYDVDADDVEEDEIGMWVSTMRDMRESMCFDKTRIRALHPYLFWGFLHPVETENYLLLQEERAERFKLEWIYSRLNGNPVLVESLA